MAELGPVGPWHRKVQLLWTISGNDVPDAEPAAGDKDAPRFGVEAGLVGHVHLHVLADCHVEAGVGERQVGDTPVPDRDPVLQPGQAIEPAGNLAVFLGQVDGGDAALVLIRQEACRSADAAAGVEHVVVAGDLR